jgi:hypothetical protein
MAGARNPDAQQLPADRSAWLPYEHQVVNRAPASFRQTCQSAAATWVRVLLLPSCVRDSLDTQDSLFREGAQAMTKKAATNKTSKAASKPRSHEAKRAHETKQQTKHRRADQVERNDEAAADEEALHHDLRKDADFDSQSERPARHRDPGSLEEETLEQNAPYNKTYGIRRDEK